MRRLRLPILVCLVLCAGACAPHRSGWRPYRRAAEALDPELMPAGEITADVTQVSLEGPDRPPRPAAEQLYQKLDAIRCQCLAAAHAPVANLLDGERHVVQSDIRHGCNSAARANQLQADVLAYGALDERNRAAALALRAFYQLTEAEAGRTTLAASLTEVDQSIDALDKIRAQGIQVELEPGPLRRQHVELADRQVELQQTIARLNAQLRMQLGLDLDQPTPLWPEADLKVTVEPIDVDLAITEGLAHRADLAALRTLAARLDKDTLPAARAALTHMNPSLGTTLTKTLVDILTLFDRNDPELASRRRQLQALAAERERQITAEIRQAAAAVETAIERIAWHKEAVASWRKRVEQLKEMRVDGPPNIPFEERAAQVELYSAEADLLHEVIAWRLALVDLKSAQGLLATECGHSARGACAACCRRR